MYTIRATFKYHGSLATFTLSKGTQWFLAINDVMKFKTVAEARTYAKNNQIVEKRPELGSDSVPFIQGPRGGRYSIFGGK